MMSYERVDRTAPEMIESLSDWIRNTYVVLLTVGGSVRACYINKRTGTFGEIDQSCDP